MSRATLPWGTATTPSSQSHSGPPHSQPCRAEGHRVTPQPHLLRPIPTSLPHPPPAPRARRLPLPYACPMHALGVPVPALAASGQPEPKGHRKASPLRPRTLAPAPLTAGSTELRGRPWRAAVAAGPRRTRHKDMAAPSSRGAPRNGVTAGREGGRRHKPTSASAPPRGFKSPVLKLKGRCHVGLDAGMGFLMERERRQRKGVHGEVVVSPSLRCLREVWMWH